KQRAQVGKWLLLRHHLETEVFLLQLLVQVLVEVFVFAWRTSGAKAVVYDVFRDLLGKLLRVFHLHADLVSSQEGDFLDVLELVFIIEQALEITVIHLSVWVGAQEKDQQEHQDNNQPDPAAGHGRAWAAPGLAGAGRRRARRHGVSYFS